MEEQDYIELQHLLTKLRVHLLKELGDVSLVTRFRDKNVKLIRYIDYIRNNAPIAVNKGTISVIGDD